MLVNSVYKMESLKAANFSTVNPLNFKVTCAKGDVIRVWATSWVGGVTNLDAKNHIVVTQHGNTLFDFETLKADNEFHIEVEGLVEVEVTPGGTVEWGNWMAQVEKWILI